MGTTKSPITPREQVPYNYKNVARHRGSRVDRACAAKKTKQKEMDGKVGEGLMKRKEGKGEEKSCAHWFFFLQNFLHYRTVIRQRMDAVLEKEVKVLSRRPACGHTAQETRSAP